MSTEKELTIKANSRIHESHTVKDNIIQISLHKHTKTKTKGISEIQKLIGKKEVLNIQVDHLGKLSQHKG